MLLLRMTAADDDVMILRISSCTRTSEEARGSALTVVLHDSGRKAEERQHFAGHMRLGLGLGARPAV